MWSFPSSRWGSLKELLRFTCQPHDRPAVGAGFRCAERLAVTTGSRFLRRTECAPTPKRDRKRGGGATRRGYRPAPGETADGGVPRKRGRTARAAARPPGDRAPGRKEGGARLPANAMGVVIAENCAYAARQHFHPRAHANSIPIGPPKPAPRSLCPCLGSKTRGIRMQHPAKRDAKHIPRGVPAKARTIHGPRPAYTGGDRGSQGERVMFYTAPVTSTFLTPGRFSTWSSSSEATDPPCPEA